MNNKNQMQDRRQELFLKFDSSLLVPTSTRDPTTNQDGYYGNPSASEACSGWAFSGIGLPSWVLFVCRFAPRGSERRTRKHPGQGTRWWRMRDSELGVTFIRCVDNYELVKHGMFVKQESWKYQLSLPLSAWDVFVARSGVILNNCRPHSLG